VNLHFYRLRKEAVGKDQVVPGSSTERCERDFLSLVPCATNSNEIRGTKPKLCQAMDFTTASWMSALTRAEEGCCANARSRRPPRPPAVLQHGTSELFTKFGTEPRVGVSSFRGRAVPRASHDSNRSRGAFVFCAIVDAEAIHSVFQIIAAVLAVGALVIVFCVGFSIPRVISC
jgi:hypothetical protein